MHVYKCCSVVCCYASIQWHQAVHSNFHSCIVCYRFCLMFLVESGCPQVRLQGAYMPRQLGYVKIVKFFE